MNVAASMFTLCSQMCVALEAIAQWTPKHATKNGGKCALWKEYKSAKGKEYSALKDTLTLPFIVSPDIL